MFVILGRDAMSDSEEGLTEYLKGVWLKIRPGLSVMLGIIILMNLLRKIRQYCSAFIIFICHSRRILINICCQDKHQKSADCQQPKQCPWK